MNNNENQNLNNIGMNQGSFGPNPIPPQPNPIPQPEQLGKPMNNQIPVEPINQMPTANAFGTQSLNMGQVMENNINGPVNQPVGQTNPQAYNQMNQVNLAPEGMVTAPVAPPVVQSGVEPLMSSTLTENTVLNPNIAQPNAFNNANPMPNQGMPQPEPNMGGVPPVNNMGLMGGIPTPPVIPNNQGKEKKKMNKTLLLVLIIVLIAAVGFGLYYFLFLGKNKAPAVVVSAIMPEELEAGRELVLDNPATYVKVTGMDISNCKVESTLNTKKVGSYEYTVTCGTKVVGPNKVTVKDTTAPTVKTKNLYIVPGDSIYPDDFIEKVDDMSECTYEFETDTSTINLGEAGEYEIAIKVIDAYENETLANAKLIIDPEAPQEYLYCEGVGKGTIENAKIYQTYKYGISGTGNIYNMLRIITYKFDTLEEYQLAEETIEEDSFDGNTGRIDTDIDRYSIMVTQEVEEETLSTEFNLNPFPKTSLEIEEYHNGKDEMCYMDVE